jgi:hypothetical protein
MELIGSSWTSASPFDKGTSVDDPSPCDAASCLRSAQPGDKALKSQLTSKNGFESTTFEDEIESAKGETYGRYLAVRWAVLKNL